MDKAYNKIWILFTLILAFALLGFFKSYFIFFPAIKSIPVVHHFHTGLFLLWFGLLFLQPFLIYRNKIKIHRFLGKCTYVLVPLMAASIFLVTKKQYLRESLIHPRADCIAQLIIPLPQLVIFVLMYILALVHVKNTVYHMKYIIGTSLVLIGPGLGRALISLAGISFQQSVQLSFLLTEIILGLMIIHDIRMGNRYKPFAVLLIIFLCCHVGWFFMPYSALWQTVCGKFADLFFTP